jgi:hypothetical protein
LGWLAFLVFVFREIGGFDWLMFLFPPEESKIHLPASANDWLHMVELVHMKLFLGMLIYFLLISRAVAGCVKHVTRFEEMRIKARDKTSVYTQLETANLRNYTRWRSYFIANIMSWKEKRPWVYKEMLHRLNFHAADDPGFVAVREALDDNFAFSAYLAYSVCECALDTVEVHPVTWCIVLIVFVIFALLHRFASLESLKHITPVFIVAAFVLMVALRRAVTKLKERVEVAGTHAVSAQTTLSLETPPEIIDDMPSLRTAADESGLRTAGQAESFNERHSTELWVLRLLQVILFVLSYSCARTVGDPKSWQSQPVYVLFTCGAFILLFVVLGAFLLGMVPDFAAIMALPPYIDKANVKVFFRVLDEYSRHVEHRSGNKRHSSFFGGSRGPREIEELLQELPPKLRESCSGDVVETFQSTCDLGDNCEPLGQCQSQCARFESIEKSVAQLAEQQQNLVDQVELCRGCYSMPGTMPAITAFGGLMPVPPIPFAPPSSKFDEPGAIADQVAVLGREVRRMEQLLEIGAPMRRGNAIPLSSLNDSNEVS